MAYKFERHGEKIVDRIVTSKDGVKKTFKKKIKTYRCVYQSAADVRLARGLKVGPCSVKRKGEANRRVTSILPDGWYYHATKGWKHNAIFAEGK